LAGSGTIEREDRRAAWARGWRAPAVPGGWGGVAAFAFTGASVGLLAADRGGYYFGAWPGGYLGVWRTAIAVSGLVMLGILAGTRGELRLSRSALIAEGGMVLLWAWTAASWLWSDDRAATTTDIRFLLVYVAALAALILVAAGGRAVPVALGTLAGITGVAAYSIATRLYPGVFGMFTAGSEFGRLYQPIGYWNALGAYAGIGVLLALGFAARGNMLVRMLAAVALIPLAPVVYLTFSRGALISLGVGFLVMVALDRRRVQLVAAMAAGSVGAVGAILAVHGHTALTAFHRQFGPQKAQGEVVAARLVALAPLAMGAAALFAGLEARFTVPRRVRTIAGVGIVLVACLAVAIGVQRFGSPVGAVRDAVSTIHKPAPTFPGGDLNRRFASLSLNGRALFWKAAWHDFTDHPVIGSGGATFHHYWMRHRPVDVLVYNAHSLELETMAELGVIGLALVIPAVFAPIWAGVRRRGHPLAAAVTAAYIAFMVESSGDWTWQLPGATLAALACAAVAMSLGDDPKAVVLSQRWRIGGAVLAGAVAVAGIWAG
jgi:O-Antigen ligase